MISIDDVIAIAEDEPLCWISRDATRHEARRLAREVCGDDLVPLSDFRVTAAYMRPAIDEDECGYVDEGWHFVCAKDHPAAIPVWRVEQRGEA